MTVHMKREIDRLKQMLMSLCEVVEESLRQAVEAIQAQDEALAKMVISRDSEIDQMEVDVEEECLKILALYQPVAIDLRFIITAMKINNDLERIGDLAVNLAERATFLSGGKRSDVPLDFDSMTEKTKAMLRRSLEALVNMDSKLAYEVCAADDEVDEMNHQMFLIVQDQIRQHPDQTDSLIQLLSASRYLERVADHATNIAEDVIYMIEGRIVRHKAENWKA
ncbi:MAG: PhoU family transcriptional regulator [Phycisphaerae bacterium SG8_4]|nr:MAG: PhoU family transcriptional regulator [Phycisphaerae bacterium SG8_4]